MRSFGKNVAINHSMAIVRGYERFPHIFALALTISDTFKYLVVNLQNVGQGHRVSFPH